MSVPQMQSNQGLCAKTELGLPAAVDAALPPSAKRWKSYQGFELQPTEDCPKNFLIFDQTQTRSQVMFHPAVAHMLDCSGFDFHPSQNPQNDDEDLVSSSSFLKENLDDIDALLSFDEDEEEEGDDVSTARTHGFLDCCSTASSNRQTVTSSCDDKMRQRMKEMVKTLQQMVPGGGQMNTVAVLDEAVRYLKSLKVEAQILEVGDA